MAHHARIERTFLDAACTRLYGGTLPNLKFADTLALEKRSLDPAGERRFQAGRPAPVGGALERYGLPRYKAHNALTDALAAAELFLAQAGHAAGRGTCPGRRFHYLKRDFKVMLFEIVTVVSVAFATAGVILLAFRLFGRKAPKILVIGVAAIAMIAYTAWNRHGWGERTAATLPDTIRVLQYLPTSSWFEPWTLAQAADRRPGRHR